MSGNIRNLRSEDLDQFLGELPFAIVHLDAQWDGCRGIIARKMDGLIDHLTDSTSFGYVDIDLEPDHARSIGLRNVPACSYYRGKDLVTTVIGAQQDIEMNLRIVREGGVP